MMNAHALRIGLAAAVMLAGCASRSTPPRMIPVAAPAPVESSVAAAEPPAAGPEPLPVIARLAVVQGAAVAQLDFRDAELGDLRAPRSALGDRVKKGATYGGTPGAVLAYATGSTGYGAVVGVVVAIVGAAAGAVTGTIVGGVEDAVNRSRIPTEKLDRYAPSLRAAAGDLILGPLALRDCVADQLGPHAQASIAAAETPDLALLTQQGFSHAMTLDAIGLEFMRQPGGEAPEDRYERFALTLVSRYRVHELADPARVIHEGSARYASPALRLDRWAAEQAREVHELAARGCPLLAEQIGAQLSAKFSLAGN